MDDQPARPRPLVGINTDFRPTRRESEAFTFLFAGYYDSLVEAGAQVVILPPVDLEDLPLESLDALLLVGGGDLDPQNDGFHRTPWNKPMDPRREDFDRRLCRWARDRRLPILAIGSGLQLLNVTCGGNLFYHLPADKPKALAHFDPLDPTHRHALEVTPGTLIARSYGDTDQPIRVSSQHHMAVDEVARGFRVTARCPDGVTEAIESTEEDWLAVGVQWHPEGQVASVMDRFLFATWVEAVLIVMGFQPPEPPKVSIPPPENNPDRYYTTPEAAEYLDTTEATIRTWRSQHKGPVYEQHGHAVCYLGSQLVAYKIVRAAKPLAVA